MTATKAKHFLREKRSFTPPLSTAIFQIPNSTWKYLIRTACICPPRKSARTIRKKRKSKPIMKQGRNGTGQRIWLLLRELQKQKLWKSSRPRYRTRQAIPSEKAVGCLICSAVSSARQKIFCKILSVNRICRRSLRSISIWRSSALCSSLWYECRTVQRKSSICRTEYCRSWNRSWKTPQGFSRARSERHLPRRYSRQRMKSP